MIRLFHQRDRQASEPRPVADLYILTITTDIWLGKLLDRVATRHGMASDCVATLDAALPLLHSQAYDAVIVARERGVDQAALCSRLRAEGVTSPILIVVRGDAVDEVVAGLNAGADAVLAEPISDLEFVARVRAAHRRHGFTESRGRGGHAPRTAHTGFAPGAYGGAR